MSEWGKKPSDTKSNEGVTSLPESQKRIKETGEMIIDFLLEKNEFSSYIKKLSIFFSRQPKTMSEMSSFNIKF